ncbi:MAG: hypothetical protein AB7P49_01825 [Bdellovibrionales bacterium]
MVLALPSGALDDDAANGCGHAALIAALLSRSGGAPGSFGNASGLRNGSVSVAGVTSLAEVE